MLFKEVLQLIQTVATDHEIDGPDYSTYTHCKCKVTDTQLNALVNYHKQARSITLRKSTTSHDWNEGNFCGKNQALLLQMCHDAITKSSLCPLFRGAFVVILLVDMPYYKITLGTNGAADKRAPLRTPLQLPDPEKLLARWQQVLQKDSIINCTSPALQEFLQQIGEELLCLPIIPTILPITDIGRIITTYATTHTVEYSPSSLACACPTTKQKLTISASQDKGLRLLSLHSYSWNEESDTTEAALFDLCRAVSTDTNYCPILRSIFVFLLLGYIPTGKFLQCTSQQNNLSAFIPNWWEGVLKQEPICGCTSPALQGFLCQTAILNSLAQWPPLTVLSALATVQAAPTPPALDATAYMLRRKMDIQDNWQHLRQQEIAHTISTMAAPSISAPTINMQFFLSSFPPQEWWRFFIDWKDRQKETAWLGYEQREAGYLPAMIAAFTCVLHNLHQQLSTEEIIFYHYIALKKRPLEKIYFNASPMPSKGSMRSENAYDDAYVEIIKTRTSPAGVQTMFHNMIQHEFFNIAIGIPSLSSFGFLKELETIVGQKLNLPHGGVGNVVSGSLLERDQIVTFNQMSNSAAIMQFLSQQLGSGACRFFFRGCRESLYEKITHVVNLYNTQITQCLDPQQKLSCIANFIQLCEQIHPFSDGNCRTFCMLVLYKLLLQQGFLLPILDDPNEFDGLAVSELIDKINQGMFRTSYFSNTSCDNQIHTYTNSLLWGLAPQACEDYLSCVGKLYVNNFNLFFSNPWQQYSKMIAQVVSALQNYLRACDSDATEIGLYIQTLESKAVDIKYRLRYIKENIITANIGNAVFLRHIAIACGMNIGSLLIILG